MGHLRGLQEGRIAGRNEMQQTFAEELARVQTIANKLDIALQSGIQGMENIMLDIAFEAVCKVLGTTAVSRDGVLAQVRQAIEHAMLRETLTVHLHPADLSTLRDTGVLENALSNNQQINWVADPTIELGGCILEAEGDGLDARLETQINRLRTTLLAARMNPIRQVS